MQYRLPLPGAASRLPLIEDALLGADPSAVVDRDPVDGALRVSTALDAEALFGLVHGIGIDIARERIERLPSECCGGCGG